MSDKIQNAYDVACQCLTRLEKVFKPGVKLTVIVRMPGFPEQDFLVSDDDMGELIKLVERRRDAANGITVGG